MFSLLVAIWVMEYLLKLDIFRHRNLLIEASEFAIKIENLPKPNNILEMEILKIDLWKHIQNKIKDAPWEIQTLKRATES